MFMMWIVLLSVIIVIFNVFILLELKKVKQSGTSDGHVDESVKRELTTYELERLEREEEFDKRISRLKEELASQQAIIKRGTTAEELHPSVHNLPHNSVQTRYDVLPDVEVAD